MRKKKKKNRRMKKMEKKKLKRVEVVERWTEESPKERALKVMLVGIRRSTNASKVEHWKKEMK